MYVRFGLIRNAILCSAIILIGLLDGCQSNFLLSSSKWLLFFDISSPFLHLNFVLSSAVSTLLSQLLIWIHWPRLAQNLEKIYCTKSLALPLKVLHEFKYCRYSSSLSSKPSRKISHANVARAVSLAAHALADPIFLSIRRMRRRTECALSGACPGGRFS